MINELLNIPDKKLSVEDYRVWITDLEQSVVDSCETYDRHSSVPGLASRS